MEVIITQKGLYPFSTDNVSFWLYQMEFYNGQWSRIIDLEIGLAFVVYLIFYYLFTYVKYHG